jgi:hypothetical protein
MDRLKDLARKAIAVIRDSRRRLETPPELIDDPREAIVRHRKGLSVALQCPIDDCVIFNGMSFSAGGFHPFAAAAEELDARPDQPYEGSCLQAYYARWQPSDALEALIGAQHGPQTLRAYPPYLMLAPWLDVSIEERLAWIRNTMCWESKAVGEGNFGPEDGHGLQGRVSPRKGAAEFARLRSVLESIKRRGYDRREGDLAAQILVREDEFRYRIVHGHHRAGALKALGARHLMVQPSAIIRLEDIDRWRHVQSGAWSPAEAEAYFHHHFDFDSLSWARSRGLGAGLGG